MAKTTRIHDIEKAIYKGLIKTPFAAVPFTTIKNEQGQPRKMADLTQNLKASMGVERVAINSLKKLTKEFGPNGEIVHEESTKDARIRFVGSGWNLAAGWGPNIFYTEVVDDYMEVSFYGTGLNLLAHLNNDARDARVTVDGNVEGATNILIGNTVSPVISGRGYSPKQVVNCTSGLTLGWHTIKIRMEANYLTTSGVEVLNESTQLVVNQGTPYQGGLSAKLDTQTLLDYSPAAITGTKGGRVVTYITEEGVLGQAVTEVDLTPQYITNTDHTDEEIYRKINFREFGANRGDDFSTLASTSNRAFTLDDGTTTLTGNNVFTTDANVGTGILGAAPTTGFITLTFVGTGLNIVTNVDIPSASARDWDDILVNGVSVGSISTIGSGAAINRVDKICSGLPYGTHTVKFIKNGAGANSPGIESFIIYQPKKPALPENVIELADYNVMADFVANTTAGLTPISTGVLRKNSSRETVYVGAWGITTSPISYLGGHLFFTNTSGNSFSKTFFGTGLDYRFDGEGNNSDNISVTVNGIPLTAANFPTATFSVYGDAGLGFNSTTGVLDAKTAGGVIACGFVVEGLPLDSYDIEFTVNTAEYLRVLAIDVITPIHSNNTKVGSLGMADLRSNAQVEDSSNQIDMSRAKAFLSINTVTSEIMSSYNVSSFLKVSTGDYRIYFNKKMKNDKYVVQIFAQTRGNSGRVLGTVLDMTVFDNHLAFNYASTTNGAVVGMTSDDVIRLDVVIFGELENEEDIDLEDL